MRRHYSYEICAYHGALCLTMAGKEEACKRSFWDWGWEGRTALVCYADNAYAAVAATANYTHQIHTHSHTHMHTDRHTCLSLSLINAAQASATLAVKTIFRLAFQAFYGFISTKISPLNTQIVACQRRACFIHRTEQNRLWHSITQPGNLLAALPCV